MTSDPGLGLGGQARAILDALPDATLIVTPSGEILFANKAARVLLGLAVATSRLDELHAGVRETLLRYLDRCSGTTVPLVGSLKTRTGGVDRSYELHGSRIDFGQLAVLLQVDRQDAERMAGLSGRLAELNREIRERLHAEAVLAETLAERELLLRELQHRVKNNMHMLQGLLHGAQREAENEDVRLALQELALRVGAVNAAQQLLYNSDNLEAIGSADLVEGVSRGALALADRSLDARVEVDSFDVPIQTAVPLALVINELLTNAVKHGRPRRGPQRIAIRLTKLGDSVELAVDDNGPGYVLGQDRKRASGTGLIRGLVRQLGGAFEVEGKEGARCLVRFKLPSRAAGARLH